MTLSNCYSEETDRYLNNNNLHSCKLQVSQLQVAIKKKITCTVALFQSSPKVSQNKNLHRNYWTVRKQYSVAPKVRHLLRVSLVQFFVKVHNEKVEFQKIECLVKVVKKCIMKKLSVLLAVIKVTF